MTEDSVNNELLVFDQKNMRTIMVIILLSREETMLMIIILNRCCR